MIILGDIGNTETKICLINKNLKVTKKFIIPSKEKKEAKLNNFFKQINLKKIDKILFCSVVPKSFNLIKKFIFKKSKKKCFEVKDLKLKSLINVKVNYNQVGSDRLTNAISLVNNKDNLGKFIAQMKEDDAVKIVLSSHKL